MTLSFYLPSICGLYLVLAEWKIDNQFSLANLFDFLILANILINFGLFICLEMFLSSGRNAPNFYNWCFSQHWKNNPNAGTFFRGLF